MRDIALKQLFSLFKIVFLWHSSDLSILTVLTMNNLEEKEHVILSYFNSTIAQSIPTMKSQRMNSVKHLEETGKIQHLDRMLGQDWEKNASLPGNSSETSRTGRTVPANRGASDKETAAAFV